MLKKYSLLVLVVIIALCTGCSKGRTSSKTSVSTLPQAASTSGNTKKAHQKARHGAIGKILWKTDELGWVDGAPAIGPDGTLYAVSNDEGEIFALDSKTGKKKWTTDVTKHPIKYEIMQHIPGQEDTNAFSSSPVIGPNGKVYVGSLDKRVYALDSKTGVIKWTFMTGDTIQSSPVIGPGDMVIIGSGDGTYFALNGRTGAKMWAFNANMEGALPTPNVGSNGLIYLYGYSGGSAKLYALDSSGKITWERKLKDGFSMETAVGFDGTVYACIGTRIYALDGTTGTVKWKFDAGSELELPTDGLNNMLYVTSHDWKLYAIDCKTGVKKWTINNIDSVFPCLVIGSDGTVYVGCTNPPGLEALNGKTGKRKWVVQMLGPASNGIIDANDTIYTSSANILYAIK